ncbi:MAG: hypothetical protein JWR19_3449 [Pedosphaera sp.]|nr:hypothetical protein [Pedosphaera sp.]
MNDKKVRSAEFQQGIFTTKSTKGTKVGERQRIFDQPSRRRFRRRQGYGGRDGAASRINRIGSGLGTGMDGRTTGLVRVVNLRIVKAALRMDKAGQGNLRMNFFMVLGPSTFAKASAAAKAMADKSADRSGRVTMGTNTRFCHPLRVVGVLGEVPEVSRYALNLRLTVCQPCWLRVSWRTADVGSTTRTRTTRTNGEPAGGTSRREKQQGWLR